MSNTLAHDLQTFVIPETAEVKPDVPATASTEPEAAIGYRWVSKRWRVLPNGKRDYAAFHGRTAFSDLLPVSSRFRTHKR